MAVMERVRILIERFQTTSPYELAKALSVDVRHESLPKVVRSLYYPDENESIIVLNNTSSDACKRFMLSYQLCNHLYLSTANVYACKTASETNVSSIFFAGDLLRENGDYDRSPIDQFYLGEGVPEQMVSGLTKIWIESGRPLLGKNTTSKVTDLVL